MKRARTDSKDASDGVRQEKEEEEEEVEEEEEEMSPRHAKAARLDEAETAVAGVGLESVGDDALMLIMDWCGLKASVRAFFLANRHLHSLLVRHQGLWRRAYLNLYRGHQKKTKKKTMESDDEESSAKDTMKKEPMVTVVEDYYAAYVKAMSKWSGSFEFYEDGVPLAESDGDLTIKVDFFGRATWEGYGVGCGRAGEYTSLHCLAGKGKLVLEDKKGEQVAYVVGAEDSKDGRCERVRHYNDDEDEEDDEEDDDDDDEDDDNDEKADEEKIKKQREIEARREKKRKEREEAQNYPDRWIELNLAKMRKSSFFFGRVRYDLHVGLLRMGRTPRQRKWCTGGGVCRYWHEDMEW